MTPFDPSDPPPGDSPEADARDDYDEALVAADAPETRRTPIIAPLAMTDDERDDWQLGSEL